MSRFGCALAALAAASCAHGPPATTTAPAATTAPATATTHAGRPGTVRDATLHSDALGVDKRYRVWLPAGYDDADGARRYPVIYMLHGFACTERDWIDRGHLDAAAQSIDLQAIVVMPDGDGSFYADAATAADYDACMHGPLHPAIRTDETRDSFCVRRADYERYIVDDLIAHVDATYRTVAERRGRAIGGFSMGGFGALSLALRHRELFVSAASHSGVVALLYAGPHPYRSGRAQLVDDLPRWVERLGQMGLLLRYVFGTDLGNWRAHDPATLAGSLHDGELALYIDCGTEDQLMLETAAAYLHDVLLARGVRHHFALVPGRHDFALWSARVADSLAFHQRQFQAAGL